MRILAHRLMAGANRHRDGPVDRIVVRPSTHEPAALSQLPATLGVETAPDIGSAIGALALHLQRACGAEVSWTGSERDADGDIIVFTQADAPDLARVAAKTAATLVGDALAGKAIDLVQAALDVEAAARATAPPPSTRNVLDAARRRGIPTMPLPGDDLHQLGWGHRQQRLWRGLPGDVSGLGSDIAGEAERSKEILQAGGIRTPRAIGRQRLEGAREAAEELGYPVAVKPLRGRGGCTPLVERSEDLAAAFERAKAVHRYVVVEDHIRGLPHEILVFDGRALSAVRLDAEGPVDVTDALHPGVRLAVERAARLCHVDVAGVQIVASTLAEPFEVTRGAIVGIDPSPDHARHEARNVAEAFLDRMFPEGDGRIPLVAVTGTNGKTTTVRLISHVLKLSGARVGVTCTGAVEVENQSILRGDYSGPAGARAVLREADVTHAVLEVARGGILRSGLGFDRCDVAVFLNVGRDHFGQGGIHSIEDLAHLKSVLVRSVRDGGTVVLNADDPIVWAKRHDVSHRARIIPFTLDPEHPDLAAHLAADPTNVAVTVHDDTLVLHRGSARFAVADVFDVPITLSGAAQFNVQNAMAAIAATYAVGARQEATRMALTTFNPTTGQLPGRMNLLDMGGVRVLLDYGHNVPALEALATVIPRLARGRKINVANAAGNRRDEDLRAFGAQIAKMYDRVIVCDPDPRRRVVGQTAGIIRDGILAAGFPESELAMELDELRAVRRALAESRPGDLVVLQADGVDDVIALCTRLRARLEAGESPSDLNEELLGE